VVSEFHLRALAIYLLVKAGKESPFKPLMWLNGGIDFIQEKWRGLFENA